jgi:hypothetical protein
MGCNALAQTCLISIQAPRPRASADPSQERVGIEVKSRQSWLPLTPGSFLLGLIDGEPKVTLHRSLAFSNGRTTFSPAC